MTIRIRVDVILRRFLDTGLGRETFAAATGIDVLALHALADHDALTIGFLSRTAEILHLPVSDLLLDTSTADDHDARLVEAVIAAHPGIQAASVLDTLGWGPQRLQGFVNTTQAVLARDRLHTIAWGPDGGMHLQPGDQDPTPPAGHRDYESWFEYTTAPGVLDAAAVLDALHHHLHTPHRPTYLSPATAQRLTRLGLLTDADSDADGPAPAELLTTGLDTPLAPHPDLLFALGLETAPDPRVSAETSGSPTPRTE